MIQLLHSRAEAKPFWSFVYFHREVEDYIARTRNASVEHDLIHSDTAIPAAGVHDVMVYEKPAILYLWDTGKGHLKGLVVFETDLKGHKYAIESYNAKSNHI